MFEYDQLAVATPKLVESRFGVVTSVYMYISKHFRVRIIWVFVFVRTQVWRFGVWDRKHAQSKFWEAGGVIPSPNMGTYPKGNESLIVVNSVPGMITKIEFQVVDLECSTDRLYLIDGDSVVSSRVGGIFDMTLWGDVRDRLSGFYPTSDLFFISGGSFALHIIRSAPPASRGNVVLPTEASSGRSGVRFSSEVKDPQKVDHVVVTITVEGAPPFTSYDTAKVARQMALLVGVMSSRVSVQISSRRSPEIMLDMRRAAGDGDTAEDEDEGGGGDRKNDVNTHDTVEIPINERQGRTGRGRGGDISIHAREKQVGGDVGHDGGGRGERGWRLRASQNVTLRVLAGSPSNAMI